MPRKSNQSKKKKTHETVKIELETDLVLFAIKEGIFEVELLSLTDKGFKVLKEYIDETYPTPKKKR